MHKDLELREVFLLALLRHLSHRLAGKRWAVRGGSCMRFYHRSPRVPEDLELDVEARVAPATVREAVESALSDKVFSAFLASKGIKSAKAAAPSKTGGSLSWKVTLVPASGKKVAAVVEAAFRKGISPHSTGTPVAELLEGHGVPPFSAPFYGLEVMAAQTVSLMAAGGRNAARHLFDLDRLFNSSRVKPEAAARLAETRDVKPAVARVSSFPFSDFRRILPFLDGDPMRLYSDPRTFNEVKSRVGKALARMASPA